MRPGTRVLIGTLSLLLLPAPLRAQNFPPLPAAPQAEVTGMGDYTSRGELFLEVNGKVITMKGEPVFGALVQFDSRFGSEYRVLETDRNGQFSTRYVFADQGLKEFTVNLAVSKKGFQRARRSLTGSNTNQHLTAFITLRPALSDPSLLPEADLINGVAPRLKNLGPADGLSPKETPDYNRGVQVFLERKRLDLAVQLLTKVVKRDPACLACKTMLSLAELNWGDWDSFDADLRETVNAMIADKSLRRAEPLLAYGVLLSWKHEPTKAAAYFTEALNCAPHNALALQELGRAEAQDLNWEAANEHLTKALAAGAGPEARLLHAEALLWAGTADEAQAELDRYLNGRDVRKMPLPVRTLAVRITEKKKNAKLYAAATAKRKARGEKRLDYINHPPTNLPDFEPASNPAALDTILSALGESVAKLYQYLPDTSSTERISEAHLNYAGESNVVLRQKFRYLCLIESQPRGPVVNEYRADSTGSLTTPRGLKENLMITSGFVSAPLLLHPTYQKESTYRYLGRQKLQGTTAYVVAFAQNPAKARIRGSFSCGENSESTYVQGLVWIDEQTHNIVHLKTDLLMPLAPVKLNQQTTEIDFREVHFHSLEQKFWLPSEVTVTIDWGGRLLRNKHEYSDFKIFNVEQRNKIGLPKEISQSSEPTTQP